MYVCMFVCIYVDRVEDKLFQRFPKYWPKSNSMDHNNCSNAVTNSTDMT